jgi:uncharacterized protein YbjT (DUF2867 family)
MLSSLASLAPLTARTGRLHERAVRASDLDWVLVRPPRFVVRKPGGNIRVIREGERGVWVTSSALSSPGSSWPA